MSTIANNIDALTYSQFAILGLVFVIIVLVMMSMILVFDRRDPVTERLRKLASGAHRSGASLRNGDSGSGVNKVLARVGSNVVRDSVRTSSSIGRRLTQAGYRSPSAVMVYYGIRVFLALILPTVLGIAFYMGVQMSPGGLFLILMGAAALGFYLPVIWLYQRMQRRREDVQNGFPDALDMLLVCVEAGASLATALERVGQEIGRAHPILAEELTLMALEINAGTGRAEALRRFADRVGVDQVTSFVTLLIQSEAFGTNIADSLRIQADDMRRKRMLRAEEKANKLPVKIALPLGLFIFPALLIVIMTPVVIRIMVAMNATS